MLDVRRLAVFKAVFDHGSITAAASDLGYSASAVSQSIAALERETRLVLFERFGRGIRPTQAGELLADHVRGILEQVGQAEEALDAFRSGRAGRIRVAAFATAGAALVPRALAQFTERHPGVGSELFIAETDDALQNLYKGQIDVAVIATDRPVAEVDKLLIYRALLDDPYKVVLPRTHPLAQQAVLELADLADESWIATASARCNCLPTITEACARAGFQPKFVIEADEFATAVGFVAAGLGVAMVPLLALGAIPSGVSVHAIVPEPLRHVYAVTRSQESDQVTIRSMVRSLGISAGSFVRAVA